MEETRQSNRRKFVQLTGTTLAGAGVSGLAGCTGLGGDSQDGGNSGDEGGTQTIQVITDHSSPEIQETLRNAFDDWASTVDQDVEAEFLFRGFDEVVQTLQRSFETGDIPEVAFLNSEWAWRFGEQGRLADMSDRLQDQSIPEQYQVEVGDGSVFWPHDIGVMTMWHRGDVYDAAGIQPATTWDEQLSNMETLSSHLEGEQMDPVLTFANPNVGVTQYNYDAQMMMNGVSYLDPSDDAEEVDVVLDQEPNRERAIEVLNYLNRMYQFSPESTSYEWTDMVEVYMSELVSTTYYTGRPLTQAMRQEPDGLGANTRPAPYPQAPLTQEGEADYQTVMTVGGFFCPAESGNTELAKDFVSHYMTTDWYVESLLSVPLHNVPPDVSVMDKESFQSNDIVSQRPDVVEYYKEYADDGVLPIERTDPPLPYYFDLTMYTYIIPTMIAEGITGRKEPGQAVDDAAAELRNTLPEFQE
ncbi:ABC transporter substrate-binding protein [Halorarum halobium]|uniref:ABC transporter substrate-binding protein n=1 Tax=Halorarum halobium TaxID=3075121 RepID=UPI0028AD08BB|nr:extracellular solute-binding protein [Halobaculum sp. XH14]